MTSLYKWLRRRVLVVQHERHVPFRGTLGLFRFLGTFVLLNLWLSVVVGNCFSFFVWPLYCLLLRFEVFDYPFGLLKGFVLINPHYKG
jgi:hypothetical protein